MKTRSCLCLVAVSALALMAALQVRAEGGQIDARPVSAPTTPGFSSDRFSVEVIGAGPDVILIPGFASSREVWQPLAEYLSATHRVHLVQLSGFAGEAWTHDDGPFVQPVVEEVARYAQTMSRPSLVGHSMGGLISLMVAQQHPDRVQQVMTVDSLPFFGAMMGPAATSEVMQPLARQMAGAILNSPDEAMRAQQHQTAITMMRNEAGRAQMVEWSMRSDRRAMAAALSEVMTTDVRPQLAAMTTPVWAVYASDANGGVPAIMADGLWGREYATVPGVTLKRVDDARHFIMIDQPEVFSALVAEFLSR